MLSVKAQWRRALRLFHFGSGPRPTQEAFPFEEEAMPSSKFSVKEHWHRVLALFPFGSGSRPRREAPLFEEEAMPSSKLSVKEHWRRVLALFHSGGGSRPTHEAPPCEEQAKPSSMFSVKGQWQRILLLLHMGSDSKPSQEAPLSEEEEPSSFDDATYEEMGMKKADLFTYEPTSFWQRLSVGLGLKRQLATSTLHHIAYRTWCKWLLVFILVICAAFLHPQLLPQWLGFEWSSTEDLCKYRESKLEELTERVHNLTYLPEAALFEAEQRFRVECMNESAALFYHGKTVSPPRFLWPSECTKENVGQTLSHEVCTGPTEIDECEPLGGFLGAIAGAFNGCEKKTIPRECRTVTDKESVEGLVELEKQREALQMDIVPEENVTKVQGAAEKGGEQILDIINQLIRRVDFAGNLFIVYNVLAIVVGTPLVVYKREKTSRILGAGLSLRKGSFILVVVIAYSIYESVFPLFRNGALALLFRNFTRDPCWVDSKFASSRVSLISETCNNISTLNLKIEQNTLTMNLLYYNTSLFGLCADAERSKAKHPSLDTMERIRQQYDEQSLTSPGQCNATELDRVTADPPHDESISKFRSVMSNGVIAQLLLKIVLTQWFVHLIAFLEPMVLHGGKVELWGRGKNVGLSDDEAAAITRFAKDKHLVQLMLFSVLLMFEIFLIIYSIATVEEPRPEPGEMPNPILQAAKAEFVCPFLL